MCLSPYNEELNTLTVKTGYRSKVRSCLMKRKIVLQQEHSLHGFFGSVIYR